MRKSVTWWLKTLTHIGAWLPLAIIVYDFAQDNLTAEPVREVTLRLGKTALIFLILSLTCTPFNTILGIKSLLPLRRTLGLYTFFYACLHLMSVVGLDYAFDFDLLKKDILEKRFALFGIAAFLCLLPLAITSGRKWAERLGKRWERIHQLAYLAVLLAATHYIAQTKIDFRKPATYAALVVLLLMVRIPAVRVAIMKVRSSLTPGGK
ncbi:MAG: sulfoxide reductase heme-binding subunit YedZ [Chloroflexi bacterium]|nr:sulfoxide reductase heme-binding subunit YedZ [Chloroflexota bacterium]